MGKNIIEDKLIIFSPEMVQAILEGRKTQTRRIIKPQPSCIKNSPFLKSGIEDGHGREIKIPWKIGMKLLIKEKFYVSNNETVLPYLIFCAEIWKSSFYLSRLGSWITLEIVDVTVERLKDILDEDCWKEGISEDKFDEAEHYSIGGSPLIGITPERCVFSGLWESIHGPGSWDKNPWVWKIEFEKL